MKLKTGDVVRHPVHGIGEVSSTSENGMYCVVRYVSSITSTGFYRRACRQSVLEKI